MASVAEYLKWRGDLEFERDPINEVDGLIFSILSYMDFSPLFPEGREREQVKLRDAVGDLEVVGQIMKEEDLPFLKDIPDFVTAVANTRRFGQVAISSHVSILDQEKTKQFSATVFSLGEKIHVAAFRGTDDSLAGWKEDLQMGYKSHVPAQQEGKVYLGKVMDRLEGVFHTVGHSKGGNVAIYAAANLPEGKKELVEKVYNYDGPGFHRSFVESRAYESIVDRVETILPESSVVGVLLEQKGRYKAVRCTTDLALMQHNPFLWMLEGTSFIQAPSLSRTSMDIRATVQEWLKQLSTEQQEVFVNALFSVFERAGISSFADMSEDAFSSAMEILKAYSMTDEEKKRHIKMVVDMLWSQGGKTLKRNISADIGAVIEKNKARRENREGRKNRTGDENEGHGNRQ